jgi:predicted MFS family arabinose efflux permease
MRAGVPLREPAAGRGRLTGLSAVFLVAAVAAVAQAFGRFSFGVLLPAIRNDLGLSNTVGGSLGTANVAAYLIGTLAVASISGRIRLLSIMRIGMILAVTGLGLAAIAPGPRTLAAALFLAGLGGAFSWIPAPVVAASALAPERRPLAVGILSSGMGAGVVLSGQIAGFVRSSVGDSGWRSVYAVLATIAAVVVCAAFLLLSHRQDELSTRSGFGGFDVLRRMSGWLPVTVAYVSFGLMYLLVIAFLATKLEDDNQWTSGRASLAFTVMGVAMVFGGPAFILLAQRSGPRRALVVAFSGWIAATLVLIPAVPVPTFAAAVASGMLFSAMPTLFTLYVVTNTTAADYGPSFAAATFAFGVAQMVSPQLGGLLADVAGSFTPVFLTSAGLAAVGLLAVLRLPKHSPSPRTPPRAAPVNA